MDRISGMDRMQSDVRSFPILFILFIPVNTVETPEHLNT
jgi:hypothetical protein